MQEQHKKQPEISIIVPVYKTERFLSACISSILAQTFTDFELILVDDGSPDSCPALCDAAAAKDSRIRVIHQKNCGLSGARNAGLDAAEGEWIAFVDSDDTITPDFCAKLYHAAQEAGAQMAVCNYRQVDEALTPIREQYLHVRREVLTPEQALEHSTLLPYMVVWNKLYHRSIFAQLRFAEGKLNEDTLLIAYAYEKADRIANIPDVLYLYRKVAGSIVNSKVTLRNLDRVEANYTVFECVRRHGITVSGCVNDGAVITVDGAAVEQKPVNGVVTLPQVAVGSTIGMQYTAPWGAVTTASVQFADKTVTTLAFENPVTEGGVPAAGELNTLLTAHYAAYLDALNNQDTALISGCTEEYKAALAQGVVSDTHKANLYVMGTAECNPAAIKSTAADGTARVSCYVKLTYTHSDRESHEETPATAYRVYTFTWADGWKVSASADSTEEAYNAASVDALP